MDDTIGRGKNTRTMSSIQRCSRAELAARLRERRSEIEATVLARVYAVSDPAGSRDPNYVLGLRDAVGVALDYGIAGIEAETGQQMSVPQQLLTQARGAALNGISLDTVLRRYVGGYSSLTDFVLQEAEAGDLMRSRGLQDAQRAIAAAFDRMIIAVSGAYTEAAESRFETAERRQGERVRRLLAGELIDDGDLEYDLDAWHLAAIASGPGAVESVRDLSTALDRSLLLVRSDPNAAWAWLGGRRRTCAREALRIAEQSPPGVFLALGEPGCGIEGWRLSHRQAKAALSVALRGGPNVVSYIDVALLASALSDEVLAGSLHSTYLAPLETERDGGRAIRRTLRTYFKAARNVSSTAAALGVSRRTVGIRLQAVEEKIGRPLKDYASELELALRLRELDRSETA